jgi:hypothetical protein
MMSKAQDEHLAKINRAKAALEQDGKTIKPEHVQAWALLEIAGMLRAIHFQLVQMQVSQFGKNLGQK